MILIRKLLAIARNHRGISKRSPNYSWPDIISYSTGCQGFIYGNVNKTLSSGFALGLISFTAIIFPDIAGFHPELKYHTLYLEGTHKIIIADGFPSFNLLHVMAFTSLV